MNKINMNNLATLSINYDDTNMWTNKYKFYYNNFHLQKSKIFVNEKTRLQDRKCLAFSIRNPTIPIK